MASYTLGAIERRFAELIWSKEPITSGELVNLAAEELGWKKSTTYTVIRRFVERGLFQNQEGIVTSLVSQEEFCSQQSKQFVEENFGGSLPQFIAAFTARQKLSKKEIEELQQMIAEHKDSKG